MIGIITSGKSLTHAVQYNERKVKKESARFLQSMNFGNAAGAREWIDHLEKQAALKKRGKMPSFHATLSWPPGSPVDDDKMRLLSRTFMDRIGFGKQPYLVYEHLDTGNPHVHIVSTWVNENGKRIRHLGKGRLHNLLLDMEKEFGLTSDRTRQKGPVMYEARPFPPVFLEERPILPIRTESETTVQAMVRTLEKVLGTYHFTSIEEFNAILRPYNMKADKGRPGSRIYEHRGLVYKAINKEGKMPGHYIKSSRLPGKPTLPFLEHRFEQNKPHQNDAARRARNLMDLCLTGLPNYPLARLKNRLEGEGIHLHWTIPKKEETPSIVYVDHKQRWAFSENVLGENYTAQALMKRFNVEKKDLTQALEHSLTQQKRNAHGRELNL